MNLVTLPTKIEGINSLQVQIVIVSIAAPSIDGDRIVVANNHFCRKIKVKVREPTVL
jgi:hypothetical protein